MIKSLCNSHGQSMNLGNSAYNGPLIPVRHDWHCPCHWCLVGHR